MSERKFATSTSLPLFAILLGALAFNVSSWPGQPKRSIQSSSLSSEIDRCGSMVETSDDFKCDITHDEVATGDVSAKFETRQVRDRSKKDDPTATKPVSAWKIDVCMRPTKAASDDGAGVVKGNPDCISDTVEDDSKVAEKIREMTLKRKTEIEQQIADAKEKQERADLCEEKDGKDISEDPAKVLECKADRLSSKKGEEQAQYFEDEIQPALKDLAGCVGDDHLKGLGGFTLSKGTIGDFSKISEDKECRAQREQAFTLIKKLKRKYGRNKYVRESLQDLGVYATYNAQMDQLLEYGQLPANDPRRREAAAMMQDMQQRWSAYRSNRGIAYDRMRTPMDWENFNVGSTLATDMNGYSSDLISNFARINQIHQQYLAATGQTVNGQQQNAAAVPIIATGDGRNARGMPSTSYQGGPNGGNPTVAPMMTNSRGSLQTQSTNRVAPGTPAANGKPSMGQRVLN